MQVPTEAKQMAECEAFNNSQDTQCYHKTKEVEKWTSLALYYVCVEIGQNVLSGKKNCLLVASIRSAH